MPLERCLEGLVPVAKALNVLHGLPQNTGCKHGPGKTARTWFGHLVRIGGTFVNAGTLTHFASRDVQCDPMFAIAAIMSATLIYSQLLTLVSARLLLATLLFSASLATLLSATPSYSSYFQLL